MFEFGSVEVAVKRSPKEEPLEKLWNTTTAEGIVARNLLGICFGGELWCAAEEVFTRGMPLYI
jgi:hypothetical protein